MSKALTKNRYQVTMYADDDRKTVFYQFSIGTLTPDQHARFLHAGKFHNGIKGCTCCVGAIYVVHVRGQWDSKKFPITSNPGESVPGKDKIVESDLDQDAEFIKAQTAWDMLRKQPLYRKETEEAYRRRKKIFLDARWFQRLAYKIRRIPTTPSPPKNDHSAEGSKGRPSSLLHDWIYKRWRKYLDNGQHKSTRQIIEEDYNKLTQEKRVEILQCSPNDKKADGIKIPIDREEREKLLEGYDAALYRRKKKAKAPEKTDEKQRKPTKGRKV